MNTQKKDLRGAVTAAIIAMIVLVLLGGSFAAVMVLISSFS